MHDDRLLTDTDNTVVAAENGRFVTGSHANTCAIMEAENCRNSPISRFQMWKIAV